MNSDTGAPPVRGVQYGGAGADGVKDSVNVFRGDVDLSVPLITMPGRNGLDVKLVAFYQSNVAEQARRWNRDAPTGILGLGWDMGTEEIVLLDGDDPETGRCALRSGTMVNRLVRDDRPWLRFSVDVRPDGAGVVDARLREAFGARGMRLHADARVTAAGAGAWVLTDHRHARTFRLRETATGMDVLAGGAGYQLESFEFWQIRYHPETLSWEIVKDDGLTYVYGGLAADATQRALRWGVRWGAWTGSSDVTHVGADRAQQRYVRGWQLAEVRSKWHDAVTLEYDPVDQLVGATGLAFTKASYLRRVTDVYGRAATLVYGEKEYHDPLTDPGGAREYADPHSVRPGVEPGPYQDRYETRFLQAIEVTSGGGLPLFSLHFDYELASTLPDADPLLRGDTVKRFLTGLEQRDVGGDALPSVRFDYHRDGEPCGALRRVTYPTGAAVEYEYEPVDLPVCVRDRRVPRPDGWRRAKPRVWFGADYAVVAWVDTDERRMRLAAYSWLGDWREWTPEADLPGPVAVDSVTVHLGADWFAVGFPSASVGDGSVVHLYHRDTRAPGQWLDHGVLRQASRRVELAGGDDVLLVNEWDAGRLSRYDWDWRTRTWTGGPLPVVTPHRRFVAASGDRYLVVAHDQERRQGVATLATRSPGGTWTDGGSLAFPLVITTAGDKPQAAWASGSTLFAFSHVTDSRIGAYDYTVELFRWSPDGATLHRHPVSYRQGRADEETRIGFAPAVVADALVGAGPNLLRFDGVSWRPDEGLLPTYPIQRDVTFAFAYGDDIGMMSEITTDRAHAVLDVYDPASGTAQRWSPGAIPLATAGPLPNAKRRFQPTVGGDYLSIDTQVFHASPLLPWRDLPQHPIHTLDPATDTTTVINQGPSFLAGLVLDTSERPKRTDVVLLENGRVARVESITEQYRATQRDGRPVATGGTWPTGRDAFFTFPLTTPLDDAPHVTLYRCVGGSVRRQVRAWVVRTVRVHDGFETRATAYRYDAASAAADAAGRVAKFYSCSVFPGCDAPTERDGRLLGPEGHTERHFANGRSGDVRALLDGMPLREDTYTADGVLVASEATEYLVLDAVLSLDPDDPSPRPLAGGFVTAVANTNTRDGIVTETRREIDRASGNPRRVETWAWNSTGRREQRTSTFTYGHEMYPGLRTWALVNAVVQQVDTARIEGADAVVTRAEATTWREWPVTLPDGQAVSVPAQHATWALTEPVDDPAFPFHGTPAPAWLRGVEFVARDDVGLVTETVDVDGRRSSTLYDTAREHVLATFDNASMALGEAAYTGFESGEPPSGWSLGAGVVVDDVAYTGVRSVRVPSGLPGPHRTLSPRGECRRFLLGVWAKVPTGGSGGWTITATVGGVPQPPQRVPFGPTDDTWRLVLAVVDLGADGVADIAVAADNTGPTPLWLDDLRFTPVASGFEGTAHDPVYGDPLAELDEANGTARTFYNPWRTPVGTVGPDGSPATLVVGGYSRDSGDGFDPAAPNQSLALTARAAGGFDDFTDGDAWLRRWTPASGEWTVVDRTLRHAGATGTLTGVCRDDDYALYCVCDAADASTVGLRVGAGYAVDWRDGAWHATHDGRPLPTEPQRDRARPQREWLLIVTPGLLLFYADGALVVRHSASAPITGAPTVSVTGTARFSVLATLGEPQLSVRFQDGAGRARQTHALGDDRTVVSGGVLDRLGRAAVATKAVGFRLDDPLCLRYRPDFVTGFDWTTGVLRGEVADYYRGQDGRSDDGGFPYSRTRFEASPLGREVERGVPGALFAVGAHSTRIAYGVNTADDLPALGLPAGRYFKTITTGPDGQISLVLHSTAGDQVASATLVPGGAPVATASRTEQLRAGARVISLPPNAFTDAGGLDLAWAGWIQRDLLGRVVASHDVDAGAVLSVHDRAGRPRFSRNARDERDGMVQYARYDLLGRAVETGRFSASWNEAELRRLAWQRPDYPGPQDGAVPRLRQAYDGSGTDPRALGRATEAVLLAADGAVAVHERFGYDLAGNLTARTVLVPGFDDRPRTVAYTYDHVGELTSTEYPVPGGGTVRVGARHDRLGNLVAVDDPASGLSATFRHDANGAPIAERIRCGTADLARSLRYESPGWLAEHEYAGLFRERLRYVDGGVNGAGYHDGRVAAVEADLPANGSERWAYAYDVVGRLRAARGAPDPGADLTVEGYDHNGNIERVVDGGKSAAYTFRAHTNQVVGLPPDAYGYDPVGGVCRAAPAGISAIDYDPVTGLPMGMTAGERVTLEHDSAGARALRGAGGDRRLYLAGPDGSTLLTVEATGSSARYVHGPAGLLAAVVDGAPYLVVRDRLGSTRALVRADGTLAQALRFGPFGAAIGEPYGPSKPIVPYLYTGRELDDLGGASIYDFGARLYDPALRRFYATDPAGQFPSPYLYVGDDPIDYEDPDGSVAWLALGIAMGIGLLIGALSGGVTYEISRRQQGESFNGAKLAAYMGIGAGAGMLGGLAGFSAGAAVSSALTTAGLATYSAVGTGVIVGATTGVVDGVVSGAVSQLGWNLVEGKRGGSAFEGVGAQALIGGVLGGVTGGVLGRVAGKTHAPVGARLTRPNRGVSFALGDEMDPYAALHGIPNERFSVFNGTVHRTKFIKTLLNRTKSGEVAGISTHGSATTVGSFDSTISLSEDAIERVTRNYRDFRGFGIDMRAVCCVGKSLAPKLAKSVKAPVLAAETPTFISGMGIFSDEAVGQAFHIYYPSQLKTAWARLFGY